MSVRKSLAFSYISNYGSIAIQFMASLIIARLLTPEEIGIFSVAIALVGFAHLLRNFGVGEYLIQEKELTQTKLHSAFTLNLALAWTLGLVVFLASTPAANFYGEAGIREVFLITSLNFLFIPLGANTISLLRRKMQFKAIMSIELSSGVVGAVTSIICAWQGLSYASLAWGAVATTATTVIGALIYKPKEFTFGISVKEIKPVIRYGSLSSWYQVLQHIGSTAPDMILGKMDSMHSVGIFSRGVGMLNLVNRLILGGSRQVIMPLFAELNRKDSNLEEVYLKAVNLSLPLAWPAFGLLMIFAEEITNILYGQQWLEAAPIIQIAGLGFMLITPISFAGELFRATGHVHYAAFIETVMAPIYFLFVLSGSYFGILYVAAGFSFAQVFRLLLTTYFLRKHYLSPIHFTIICGKNLLHTGVSLFAPLLIWMTQVVENDFILIIIGTVGCGLTWLLMAIITKHPIIDELKKHIGPKKLSAQK